MVGPERFFREGHNAAEQGVGLRIVLLEGVEPGEGVVCLGEFERVGVGLRLTDGQGAAGVGLGFGIRPESVLRMGASSPVWGYAGWRPARAQPPGRTSRSDQLTLGISTLGGFWAIQASISAVSSSCTAEASDLP